MRVKCQCGSHLFYLHVPPIGTKKNLRIVYLICNGCSKTWQIKVDTLPEVDDDGIIKKQREVE